MDTSSISLNALRAFEASARHLNFTRAADELNVTQAAVSHQVKTLEAQLGKTLFRRASRGLVLTDEGTVLTPIVSDAMKNIGRGLAVVSGKTTREVLTVGVVGTFALGFLLEHLPRFNALHPGIDVRVQTNNNVVDLWTESLDCAIRFGDGSWHGLASEKLMAAPMTPMCSLSFAKKLDDPSDLIHHPLLRSYRTRDWTLWLEQAGQSEIVANGPVFDSSHLIALAAAAGMGVALLPAPMFTKELTTRQLVKPYNLSVDCGAYWFTRLTSRPASHALSTFQDWLLHQVQSNGS